MSALEVVEVPAGSEVEVIQTETVVDVLTLETVVDVQVREEVEAPDDELIEAQAQVEVVTSVVEDTVVVPEAVEVLMVALPGTPGAPGVPGTGSELFQVLRRNSHVDALLIGQPVYVLADGQVARAQAHLAATRRVAGLVADLSIGPGAFGLVQSGGLLVATTLQWDVVTGGLNGLVPGADYFLSVLTAGLLSLDPNPGDGQYLARVGHALSATEFLIDIEPTVKI